MNAANNLNLRLVLGLPPNGPPAKIECRLHHDPGASMFVDRDHCYCHGCQRWLRQQEGLAYLLGLWDGNPKTAYNAVARAKKYIPLYQDTGQQAQTHKKAPSPLDPSAPLAFHRFLLNSPQLEWF